MMDRKSRLRGLKNSYVQNFAVAQMNLNKLIEEERLRRRLSKSQKLKG